MQRLFCLFLFLLPVVPAGAQGIYRVVDGWAVSGDIILGRVDDVGRKHTESTVINVAARYWPKGIIPYTVDPAIPNQQRITDAVNYFNQNTVIRLIPRTTEANYIQMIRINNGNLDCSSQIGMLGGAQTLMVDDNGCAAGALVHEIGHALGMYHEQTRTDHNKYITVLYENIDKLFAFAWDPGNSQSDGPFYDYLSRMHYFASNFSANGEVTTQTVPPGMPLEPTFMSPGDIEWINKTYGTPNTQTTITSNPEGLTLTVDGKSIVTPQKFDWAFGSTHTVAAATQPDPSIAGVRYAFGRWSDNGNASHTITASAGMTVFVASFVRQISFTAGGVSPAGSGTVTVDPPPPADGYYTATVNVRLTATPAPGYTFERWVSASSTLLCYLTAYGQNPGLGRMFNKVPQGCTALFTKSPVTVVATDPPGRPILVDGSSYNAPQGFAWTPGSTHTIEATATTFGTTAPVTYTFQSWDDGGAASHTVTAGSANTTITAKYKTQWELAITQPATGTGTITVSPAGSYFDAGTKVQLTATPAAGYQLTGWVGDLAGGAATQTLLMDQQRAVTATFSRTPPAIALVNGATFQGASVSPGEIVTLFGAGLGPPTLTGLVLDSSGKVATTLAGAQVTFDGVAAPLIYVSQFQTAAIVPYSVAGKATTVLQAVYNNVKTPSVTINVTDAVPGFFTANSSGTGPAALLNQDGSANSAANPAARGSVVQFFVTGEGQTFPAGVDGLLAGVPLPAPVLPVSVRIGGLPAAVQYAGGAPGLVAGVMQVNAIVPMEALPGSPSVYLVVGNAVSPVGVTLFIK